MWNRGRMRQTGRTDSAKGGKTVSADHTRIARENKTIAAMIRMQCRDQHHTPKGICPDCHELLAYARERLVRCPYQEGKTACARCPIHCYKPAMREKIRAVMRYAGPKMMYRHPILALYHLIDGRRKEPIKPVGDEKNKEHTL
jgi:hypothetical protein